jgi:hypothetical protein
MVGSILFVGAIILLLESRNKKDDHKHATDANSVAPTVSGRVRPERHLKGRQMGDLSMAKTWLR